MTGEGLKPLWRYLKRKRLKRQAEYFERTLNERMARWMRELGER